MARPSADDNRPRKKKAKKKSGSGILPIVLLGGAILAAIGVVGAGVHWAMNRSKLYRGNTLTPVEIMGVTNQEDQLFVSKNNLRQIGLALNNYHDMWNTIPPASIASADGTIQLTPGFAILPFLDNAKLYNQVVAAGGMSSPQNQALLSQPLFYWKSPAASHDATGPDAHFAWNSNVFKPEKTMQMSDIKDGWTNTLAIGEVMAGFKPWYAADNTRDPSLGFGATPEKFGGPFSGGVHFITMDGSVKFISDKIDPQVLKAISTPNGGETVAPF